MESTDQLDMLESLLSITERFKPAMSNDDIREWQRISAAAADLRDDEDGLGEHQKGKD